MPTVSFSVTEETWKAKVKDLYGNTHGQWVRDVRVAVNLVPSGRWGFY